MSGVKVWLLWLLLALCCSNQAMAYHITDNLLAGLYPEPSSEADPIRLLPAGTPVELLQRRGAFARIRLGDNSVGWVERRYLTLAKPARVMLLEQQARNKQLQQQLLEAQRQLAGKGEGEAQPLPGDPEIGELKRRLRDAQAQIGQLKEQLSEMGGQERIAALEAELEALQSQSRHEARAMPAGFKEAGEAASPESTGRTSQQMAYWGLPAAGLLLLLGFIGGIAYKNRRIAKRLGGFRI